MPKEKRLCSWLTGGVNDNWTYYEDHRKAEAAG